MVGLGTAVETEPIQSAGTQMDPDAEDMLEKARRKSAKGRFEEALSAVEKFLEWEPVHAEGLLLHAQILEALKRVEESRAAFEKLVKTHPDSSIACREYGRFLMTFDPSPGLAESQLLRCLTMNPRDAFAHTVLADVYVRTNRKQQALLHLEIAARYSSDDPRYYTRFAEVLAKLGDFSEAAKRLRRILLSDSPSKAARTQIKKAFRAKRKGRFRLYLKRVWS